MDATKNEIFSHFKSVLDNLIDNSVFFKTFVQAPQYLNFDVYGGNYGIPANITLTTGVTRACIIDEDYDWVVKFDIDEDCYGGSVCGREERYYEEARNSNLDKYFCEVRFLGYYEYSFRFFTIEEIYRFLPYLDEYCENGCYEKDFYTKCKSFDRPNEITVRIPLYAYRRMDTCGCYRETKKVTLEEEMKLNSCNSPLTQKNFSVGVEFLRNYGEEEYQRITDFLFYYDINDIHCGNVGYVNGNFVIIDYAGYYSEDDIGDDGNNDETY